MSRDPVAERISRVIRDRGISNSELAERIGAPPATVQKWVRQGAAPGAGFLALIPAALEINGHWLLTGMGPMELPGEDYELERERATARRQLAEKLIQAVGQVVREVAEGAGVPTSSGVVSVPPEQVAERVQLDAKIRREAAKQAKGTKKRA